MSDFIAFIRAALRAVILVGVLGAGLDAHATQHTDHPLLTGMPGFVLKAKTVKNFDQFSLKDYDVSRDSANPYKGPLEFEGRVTRLEYRNGPKDVGDFEVYRNHLNAVVSIGGKGLNTRKANRRSGEMLDVFQVPSKLGSPIWVVLHSTYKPSGEYDLTIIEPVTMVQSVKATNLAKDIATDGWATVYIEFDTGKAELRPESQGAISAISDLLKQDPKLKISVDGHTDNVGDAAGNRKLSLARAQAVMAAVVAQGIPAARLSAKGFGPDVPIADNRREDGRAKNRRVELMRQP